jgi:hypothetical protein
VEGHHVGTKPKTDGSDRAGCHASRVGRLRWRANNYGTRG